MRARGAVGSTGDSSAIGERAVEQNGARAIDIRDGDDGLVQSGVVPIAHEGVEIRVVAVLVAATLLVFLAEAVHRLGLVHARGAVVEAVGVDVRICVDAVQPRAAEADEGTGGEGASEVER